ncbi:hypothetical protein BCR34DRAFT_670773 [Clohesyomyces aquaticus]|uniref:Uncharacterized protein n=1 Tax=Clohesyomyces aquaticus TaxID=1231657 RepID=A0A1Y2A8A3_9PLEO|nr:hypothetical protein BCR34DRAFT_670773 [Clohesyomyces aquaticus]
MRLLSLFLAVWTAIAEIAFQNSPQTILRTDPGRYGPEIEEYHYHYQQWPIGIAVSSTGRLFATYTRGSYTFTLGEAVNKTAEKLYPSADLNLPVSALNTSFNGIPFGSANSTGLISVQAIYTTRKPPTAPKPSGSIIMPYAQPGGSKIVGISHSNDPIYATYTFPASVYSFDSYMYDIRFDLRPNLTSSRKGIAYIIDSSDEGRPGFIILDLGTGDSWRRLTQHPTALRVADDVPNGETMYYSPPTSPYLYSNPSLNLHASPSDPLSELAAHNSVSNLGKRGGNANGFEGDSNGLVYQPMPKHSAICYYDPKTLQRHGWFYVNINQFPYQLNWNNGTGGRVWPGCSVEVWGWGKIVSLG